MGEWNEKFGNRFRQGREDARLAEQRMHEKSDLLKDKGPKLWKEFKDSLQEAAKDIAGTEGFLKYGVRAEVGEEVCLVYALATGSRTATITLVGHSVKLLIVEPSGSLLSESYEIAANPKGDGVWFSREGYGGKTSKELVGVVVGGLLVVPR